MRNFQNMFWKKKINSEEYEFLYKRITELQNFINELNAKLSIVQTDNANLRGQFNRKLLGIKKAEDKEDMSEEKSINNPVILPYDGHF